MGKHFSKLPASATASAMGVFRKSEIQEINEIFAELSSGDKDGTGTNTIDRQHFGEYFSYPGVLREQIFQIFDRNTDGYIDCDEFLRGLAMCCKGTFDEKLKFCFNMFDLSGDGFIDKEELYRCLESTAFASFALVQAVARDQGKEIADLQLKEFRKDIIEIVNDAFTTCDVDRNQKLSFQEFKRWLLETPEITEIIYSVFEIRNHVSIEEVSESFAQELSNMKTKKILKRFFALRQTFQLLQAENEQYLKDIETITKQNKKLTTQMAALIRRHSLPTF